MMEEDWLRPMCVLLSGCLFFPLVYNITKHVLMKYGGDNLSHGDIRLVSEKVTCSVQAVMACSVGYTIVSHVKDIMTDTHWLTNTYAWFTLPYFAYDVWAIYQTFYWNTAAEQMIWQRLGTFFLQDSIPMLEHHLVLQRLLAFMQQRWLMLIHHLLLPVIFFPYLVIWRNDLGDFFLGTLYLIEVVVPFLSIYHILEQFQLRGTRLYYVNGFCMVVTFFCARILVFPYMYWRYATYAGIGLLQVPGSLPIKCNLGCLILLLPQLYWFWLMLCRARQHLKTD